MFQKDEMCKIKTLPAFKAKASHGLGGLGGLMKMKSRSAFFVSMTCAVVGLAAYQAEASANRSYNEYLVKLKPHAAQNISTFSATYLRDAKKVERVAGQWIFVEKSASDMSTQEIDSLSQNPEVEYIQPNFRLKLLEDYKLKNEAARAEFVARWNVAKTLNNMANLTEGFGWNPPPDNPEIPGTPSIGSGEDPLYTKQWGMKDNGVKESWPPSKRGQDFIVAVIDTGVDYTHEDLLPNMWRNPGETGVDSSGKNKANNGIDDDQNGFIDDVVGWDFASNDNKPYDLAVSEIQLIGGGGNPGHGTHCAGNVAARGDNGIGISGVAPNAKIMAMRFLTEKGSGDTKSAIKSIKYAVDMGAKVLSNSWGSEGEDPKEGEENKALREIIQYAMSKNVLFIAAAGNGHQGAGYDNDTDKAPGYPASYDIENIVSVAAIDESNNLGKFSNWGLKTVHIGAPGVKVFSTMVGNRYSDLVIDLLGIKIGWDGTSMATPHVAGAAALYWSTHPEKNWKEVKTAILSSAQALPSLQGKSVTGGKLNVKALMGMQILFMSL